MNRAGRKSVGVVVAALLLFPAVTPVKAAGALAIGACGAYGQAYDFPTIASARASALRQCRGSSCRVVAVLRRTCAAFAVDGANPCGAHGFGRAAKLGAAQNDALRGCYKDGGRECVIRTFVCDGNG